METRSFQSYKRQELSERLPSRSNSFSCVSTDVPSQDNLLQQQLGEFWSYAVDFPNRYNNHHHHHHLQNHENNLLDDDEEEEEEEEECSLEKQFLYQDFLTRPAKANKQPKKTCSASLVDEQNCVLRGEDIKDVPTTYVISGLEAQEIPVIGTYVDLRILPGFRYKVRLNQSKKLLFDGEALYLENISIGYGKRLTFESECLNENQNYFWSDSRPEGYAFALVALNVGELLYSSSSSSSLTNEEDCRQTVFEVKRLVEQKEIKTIVRNNNDVVKTVLIEFICQSNSKEEFKVSGLAFLVKGKNCRRSRLEKIEADFGNVLQRMELRPIKQKY